MTVGTDITIGAVAPYLALHIPEIGRPIGLKKFSDGQSNPTFCLTTDAGRYVLRAKPQGKLLKSAHMVDREYRVMQGLARSAVPVPKVLHLADDDTSPIGRAFFVMEFLDGRVLWDPKLPDLSPEERRAIYMSMNAGLATLHDVDPATHGLDTFGRPENYIERQITRWGENYLASAQTRSQGMIGIIDWLEQHLPSDDGHVGLVHGDYRLDNIMFARDSSEILGILDWELSTLGHPFADLAYQCMQLRLPHDSGMRGLGGLDRRELGIPSETEYVAAYADSRGIDVPKDWPFYLVFSYFRLIAILQGVVARAENGNGSNPQRAKAFARAIPVLEAQAKLIIEGGADE